MSGKNHFPENEISNAAIEAAEIQPPVSAVVFISFFTLFFAVAIGYSLITEIPIVIEVAGKLEGTKDSILVKAQTAFTVDKILVKENQPVKKGVPLVTSSETLAPENLARIRKYIGGMRWVTGRPEKDPCLSCVKNLETLAQEYLSIQSFGEVQGLLQPINDISREMIGAIESYKGIEAGLQDVRRSITLAKGKLAEINKRKAENLLGKEVEEYNTQIVAGQTRIAERYRQGLLAIQQHRFTLNSRLAELESKLEKFGRTYTVIAPFDGVISSISVKGAGELISAGQVLMELSDGGSALRANFQAQNKDIANIRNGAEVIISVDALPEIDFGTVSGNVTEIIRPMANPGGAPQMADQAMSFQVRASLARQSLSSAGVESPFLAGMVVRGKIVAGYESILKRGYRKLFKIKTDISAARP